MIRPIEAVMTCYDDAMRTIIDVRPDQLAELDKIVAEESVSRAETIRDAIDVYPVSYTHLTLPTIYSV